MNSINKIEQIITDIENYLANSKPRMFSSSEVIVNREEMEELLKELRRKTPDEIKQYQKIISNKDAILADAAERAEAMKADAEQQARALLEQAAVEHNQMISEHEIMLRAHARADEFVNMAVNKAQGIIDNATLEANNLKDAANSYMADVDTDEAYEGDTEVISDGYFHESEFRSAPYFDLQIDGITLLDTAF